MFSQPEYLLRIDNSNQPGNKKMLADTFCERLEQKLLPDVQIIEMSTDWDEAGTHHRIPNYLLLVRGEKVFPRHSDMISLIAPKLKQQSLTLKSFNQSLGMDWYLKEWEYDPQRVELFTGIRDRAITARKVQKSRLLAPELPSRISTSLAKSLLKRDSDLFLSMLLGASGVEIQRLCQVERQELGDIISESDNDPSKYTPSSGSVLGTYRTLQKLVGLYQIPSILHH